MNTSAPNGKASVSSVGFLVSCWLVGFLLVYVSKLKADEKTELPRLIKQLGHEEFVKREAASRALEAIGEPALDSLAEAAKSNQDPEIRHRAESVMVVIQIGRASCRERGEV